MSQPDVAFQIDGVEYQRADRSATAAELIVLAGLDPESHDLIRLAGASEQEKRLSDTTMVQLTPGARFMTVFTGPTPVV